jgi:hypothetical protein
LSSAAGSCSIASSALAELTITAAAAMACSLDSARLPRSSIPPPPRSSARIWFVRRASSALDSLCLEGKKIRAANIWTCGGPGRDISTLYVAD